MSVGFQIETCYYSNQAASGRSGGTSKVEQPFHPQIMAFSRTKNAEIFPRDTTSSYVPLKNSFNVLSSLPTCNSDISNILVDSGLGQVQLSSEELHLKLMDQDPISKSFIVSENKIRPTQSGSQKNIAQSRAFNEAHYSEKAQSEGLGIKAQSQLSHQPIHKITMVEKNDMKGGKSNGLRDFSSVGTLDTGPGFKK